MSYLLASQHDLFNPKKRHELSSPLKVPTLDKTTNKTAATASQKGGSSPKPKAPKAQKNRVKRGRQPVD